MRMTKERIAKLSHPRCPYCHEGVSPREDKEPCRACMAWHHAACYREHGRCAACNHRPQPAHAPREPQPSSRPRRRRDVNQALNNAAAWPVVALLVGLLIAVVLGAVLLFLKLLTAR